MSLWQHAVVQRVLFADDDQPGRVRLEPGFPRDHDDVLALESLWQTEIAPALYPAPAGPLDLDRHLADVGALLSLAGRRLRIARDHAGRLRGFSLLQPLTRGTATLLRGDPVLGPLLEHHADTGWYRHLPHEAAQADSYYLEQIAFDGPDATTVVLPALWRDVCSVLARGGRYLMTCGPSEAKQLVEALGFTPLPVFTAFRGMPFQGYLLDLTAIGVEAWIDAVIAGRRPPRAWPLDELERELRNLLPVLADDRSVSASPLTAALVAPDLSLSEQAERVRDVLRTALDTAQADSAPDDLALRALRLVYIDDRISHERAAQRLSVSRSTVFRLHKRAIRPLALAMRNHTGNN